VRAVVRKRLSAGAIVSVPLLWTLAFLFVPYFIMFTYSFYLKTFPTFEPAFQFGNYQTIISDPQYYQVLFRTFKIASIVAASALLVAYPLTYFRSTWR
jgi:spermidine/putrescine transport system permease protein